MGEPLYRMIAEDLRAKIESGELPADPGGALPTEKDLQKSYGASRNTVRDAIKFLTQLDVIETRPGQGTFVVEKPAPFVTTLTDYPDRSNAKTYVAEVKADGRTPTDSGLMPQPVSVMLTRARSASSGRPTSKRVPSITSPRSTTSGRSGTATRSRCARRNRTRRGSSSSPPTAGSRSTRSTVSGTTRTATRSG